MTLSCFDLGEQMLSVDEARQALATLIERPLGSESIPLARALRPPLGGGHSGTH